MQDIRWYQSCGFGDGDLRAMKKRPPLDFIVYAVALIKGSKIPAAKGQDYIIAKDFPQNSQWALVETSSGASTQ